MTREWWTAWLVALLALPAEPAQAEQTDASRAGEATLAAARDEFRRGAELARAQRWDEARSAFERSYRLRPHPVTSYNIAYCERAVGHPARALSGFERALAEHTARLNGVLPAHLIELAARYRDEVAARVARVELLIPARAQLSIDGLETPSTGRAVLLLDPGTHVLVVSKPGFATAVVTRDFATGQRSRLEIALEPRARETRATASSATIDRRWSYLALGTGVASLVAAGIAGSLALRKRSVLEDACGPARTDCPSSRQGDIAVLGLYADTATVAAIVGVTGIATGTALFFIATPATQKQETTREAFFSVSASGSF